MDNLQNDINQFDQDEVIKRNNNKDSHISAGKCNDKKINKMQSTNQKDLQAYQSNQINENNYFFYQKNPNLKNNSSNERNQVNSKGLASWNRDSTHNNNHNNIISHEDNDEWGYHPEIYRQNERSFQDKIFKRALNNQNLKDFKPNRPQKDIFEDTPKFKSKAARNIIDITNCSNQKKENLDLRDFYKVTTSVRTRLEHYIVFTKKESDFISIHSENFSSHLMRCASVMEKTHKINNSEDLIFSDPLDAERMLRDDMRVKAGVHVATKL